MGLESRIVSDDDLYDVICIGAGPAGLTACSIIAQAGYKVAYIEKNAPGGRLLNINKINNFPGFEGTDGVTLANALYEKASNDGVIPLTGEVDRIGKYQSYQVVYDLAGKARYCSALIIATGIGEQKLNAVDAKKYAHSGISSCVTCDVGLARDHDVAVFGNGAKAIGQAIYLAKVCPKVYLICDIEKLDGDENMMNNLKSFSNVEVVYNSIIHQVLGNDYNVTGIIVKDLTTSAMRQIDLNFVFIGLDEKPITSFIHYQGVINDEGFVIADKQSGQTKEPNIYAVGDVVEGSTKQLMNAMASGNTCAQTIISFLQTIQK
ncbi:MAG: FAD-dependent oxidoreductase [Malacoplasma sp.]|nr:FAD-dependent oxidoreductase [Malacoplasma sp.]